jgi:hypothetical protein
MSTSNGHVENNRIDKRDFDANRPLLADEEADNGRIARLPADNDYDDDDGDGLRSDGLLSDVVEHIVERDRRKLNREIVRVFSFAWGVVSW